MSKTAIWCFVLGLMSLVAPFSIIFAIVGLYLGKEALVSIKKNQLRGRVFAILGLILCVISVVLFLRTTMQRYEEINQKAISEMQSDVE